MFAMVTIEAKVVAFLASMKAAPIANPKPWRHFEAQDVSALCLNSRKKARILLPELR